MAHIHNMYAVGFLGGDDGVGEVGYFHAFKFNALLEARFNNTNQSN